MVNYLSNCLYVEKKGVETVWLKNDLNDFEPIEVDFDKCIVVTRLEVLSVKALKAALSLRQRGESALSLFKWPSGGLYFGHTNGMTTGQAVTVHSWLTRNIVRADEIDYGVNDISNFVISQDVYAKYCVEFQPAYFEYWCGAMERKAGSGGVVVFSNPNYDENLLITEWLDRGREWEYPKLSVLLREGENGKITSSVVRM